jgi:hypothetical protein
MKYVWFEVYMVVTMKNASIIYHKICSTKINEKYIFNHTIISSYEVLWFVASYKTPHIARVKQTTPDVHRTVLAFITMSHIMS